MLVFCCKPLGRLCGLTIAALTRAMPTRRHLATILTLATAIARCCPVFSCCAPSFTPWRRRRRPASSPSSSIIRYNRVRMFSRVRDTQVKGKSRVDWDIDHSKNLTLFCPDVLRCNHLLLCILQLREVMLHRSALC